VEAGPSFRLGIIVVADSTPLSPLLTTASPEAKFREFLEIRGEKLTEPRRILVRHIFDSHKHFDADELVTELHNSGRRVSRSTVYRTLRLLVEAGLLRELRLTNRTAYEHDYGYPSHDHLHCTECNAIVEFRNDEIRKLREAVSLEHGFLSVGHRFIITGICPACNRARSPRRRLDLI
jgi:Fur family transcriptional regulator, ferric uptake regulator